MRRALRRPPKASVSDWADRHVRLPAQYAAEPGPWRSDRYPYQRGMMDAASDPSVWRIVFMTSSQIGKGSCLDNIAGYFIAQDPAPILWVFPTLSLAEGFSRDRLAHLIRATPALASRVAEALYRDSANTILHKEFPGGHLTLAGANSAASLQSRPIRIVFCDEVDSFPASADGQGDPVSLATQRTARFFNRLIVLAGTPTMKGISRLEQAWAESDRRCYFVPCLGCGEFQVLQWQNVRFDSRDPETARLVCAATGCKREIGDTERLEMVRRGEWRATAPFAGTAGFHVWEGYAASRLVDLVADFLEKRKHRETLRTFVNLKLGELWEEEAGEAPEWLALKQRSEAYEPLDSPDFREVPAGVLFLTAGVDVQDDRLAVVIRGWGRSEESWLVFWGELYGDPIEEKVWRELDDLIARDFPHPGGSILRVQSYAVDSGGHRTQAVYDYVRQRSPRAMAIKGSNQAAAPVIAGRPSWQDVSWQGRMIPNGVQLWSIGVSVAKTELYARLKIIDPGPRYVHFPAGLPDDYYTQLTAEKLVTRYHKGVARMEWVLPSGARNEAFDAQVYAYAAAVRAGLQRMNWEALETAVAGEAAATSMTPTAQRPSVAVEPQRVLRSKWMSSMPRRTW